MRIDTILEALSKLPPREGSYVVAIDGRAASGKTTLAQSLKELLGAEVIHMDDFFLPPMLRTEERLRQAGGNVHYERFAEEVLPKISQAEAFSYRRFDCGKMDLDGKREVKAAKIRVVEGAYSHHPYFGDYADLKVFSDVEYAEQLRRIRARNGDTKLEAFKNRWIPLEEAYFSAYTVKENADIII